MAKKPTGVFLLKLLQLVKGIAGSSFNKACSAGTGYAFVGMVIELVLVIVQKTTGVELVYPNQHLLFCLYKICYWKRNQIIVQNRLPRKLNNHRLLHQNHCH